MAYASIANLGANYFWVLLSGQTISSLCNALIWGAGSHLSEVWFPASERATSTAISATISPIVGHLLLETFFFHNFIHSSLVCLLDLL